MPGFTVRDSAGQVWFIKFDPPGYPAMATGTEVLVARLFWGLGYHVPETHLATLRPEQLTIDDQARIKSRNGNRRRFKESDIRLLVRGAHRESDGSYRVVASKALEGRPVGGFRFYGTRSDDPNDAIPHEHRRELRGYGTFSAWLNHVDSKSINTLDTVVEQDGKRVVRHHLLDFGSTIGSAGVYPREAYEGWEYLAEGKKTLAGMPSLGLYVKNWRTIPLYRAKSVGAFPIYNTQSDPERWKPRYANFMKIQRLLGERSLAVNAHKTRRDDEVLRLASGTIDEIKIQLLELRRDIVVDEYGDDLHRGGRIAALTSIEAPIPRRSLGGTSPISRRV